MVRNAHRLLVAVVVTALCPGIAAPAAPDKTRAAVTERRLAELFDQLASDDPDLASESLRLLSESDPAAVKKLLEGQASDFDFKYGFLRQLLPFVEHCRERSLPFRPGAALQGKLRRLRVTLPFRERYRLENDIAQNAALRDIPAMEYWAVIYSDDFWEFSRSISRVLNRTYARFWKVIVQSPAELRFYLLKSSLFSDLGIVGMCNDYLKRFGRASKDTLEALRRLRDSDSDPRVRNQASKALAAAGPGLGAARPASVESLSLDQFIARLDSVDLETVGLVRLRGTEDEHRRIFDKIREERRPAALAKWVRLVEANLTVSMTPFLMGIIERREPLEAGFSNFHDRDMNEHPSEFAITVSDRVVNMLELLFSHRFPVPRRPDEDEGPFVSGSMSGNAALRDKGKTAPQWLALWWADGRDYRRWGQKLYARKLKNLRSRTTVSVDDVLEVLHSRFLKPADRGAIWQAAAKIRPPESAEALSIREGMISPAEWKHLAALRLEPETLASILQKTDVAPSEYGLLRAFLRRVRSRYSSSDKGLLFLEMCRWEPLRGALREERDQVFLREIQDGLRVWIDKPLHGQEFFREWADELRLYIESCRRPLEEQLRALETYAGPGAEDAAVQLLDTLTYSDLGSALKHLARLPLPDFQKVRYITEDFGLCVDDWSEDKLDPRRIDELAARYRALSERELYAFYLDRRGIDYRAAGGGLDYEKVRRILEYDSLLGFMGSTSHEPHVLTLIRLLELTFGTRLGYDNRFNHSIDSVTECTECRAGKWIGFLEDKKLVGPAVDDAPAF